MQVKHLILKNKNNNSKNNNKIKNNKIKNNNNKVNKKDKVEHLNLNKKMKELVTINIEYL